jgi:hypothetical protein
MAISATGSSRRFPRGRSAGCGRADGCRAGGGSASAPAFARSAAANPCGVGFSKKTAAGTGLVPSAANRASALRTSSEFPPRSKKLSSRPARSMPSTSANTWQARRSASSSGAWYGSARSGRSGRGAGSARRSSLPFVVTGSPSTITKAAGTM